MKRMCRIARILVTVRIKALAVSVAAIALVVLLASAGATGQQKTIPNSTPRPIAERAANFERAERDEWQKPNEVIKVLGARNGMVVADIGAGSGYFSRRFAKAVAPSGKVYAVDIDKEILEILKERAQQEKITNLQIVASKEDDPMLPENSVDLAFFVDSSHHIANRAAFYRTVGRALKKDGRLAILDYPPEAHDKGFCRHLPEELVPEWQTVQEANEAGFKLANVYTFIERQYFLVFAKKQ